MVDVAMSAKSGNGSGSRVEGEMLVMLLVVLLWVSHPRVRGVAVQEHGVRVGMAQRTRCGRLTEGRMLEVSWDTHELGSSSIEALLLQKELGETGLLLCRVERVGVGVRQDVGDVGLWQAVGLTSRGSSGGNSCS